MAAGEFTADGTLVDYRSNVNMPSEVAATVRPVLCHSVHDVQLAGSRILAPDPDGVDAAAGLGVFRWDMTVAVGGRVGVFIKTERADFNQLFQVLVDETPVSRL